MHISCNYITIYMDKTQTIITKKEILIACIIALTITGLFFYKTIFYNLTPFPADVLVNEYQPWRSTSYLGFNPASIPHKAQYPDTVRQIYPWKTLALHELKQGKLPLWNPYNFSGSPLLANFQSAALYPLNILYTIVSQIDGWSVLVIMQPLLAIFFTYIYARTIGIGIYGSALSAISFGFSGFISVWLEYNTVGHVILWLPFILFAIEKIKNTSKPLWIILLSVAYACALFAGHPQIFGYMFIFSSLYIWFRVSTVRQRFVVWIASALGVGIAGIQLIPGIELITNAARSPHEFTNLFQNILIQPWQFIATLFPNFFGNPATRTYWLTDTFLGKVTTIGLVPLFFLPGIFRRKEPIVRWFLLALILITIFISANPIAYILYRIPIPLLSSSSPTLMSFLFAFCLSILCGFGLDHWITEKHSAQKLIRRTIQTLAALAALYITATIIPTLHEHGAVIQRAIIYGGMISIATLSLFWVAISQPKLLKISIIILLCVHVADLFMFFSRFNAFIPKSLIYPEHHITTFLKNHTDYRYWGYGTAAIPANLASQFKGYSPEGYDPLYPKWYGEFIYSYTKGKILDSFSNSTRSDAAIISGFGENGLSDTNKNRILSALSVGYILDRTENGSTQVTFPSTNFEPVYQSGDWHIFKNLKATPKAYLADTVLTYTNASDFSSKFFLPTYDSTKSVLLEKLPPSISQTSTPGTASINSYNTDNIIIQTTSATPKILVLTDTYYPGWQAFIDGKPTSIYRANWTFRGIAVPQGSHKITMIYKPESVRYGIILSMISIGLTIYLAWTQIKRKRNE